MSNTLRIDSRNSNDYDYLVVSEHRYGGLSFVVVDHDDENDDYESIAILTHRGDVQDLVDFLLAWLEKYGGQP